MRRNYSITFSLMFFIGVIGCVTFMLAQAPATQAPLATAYKKPSVGPSDAPVLIEVFSDFECPYCLQFEKVLKQVRDNYRTQVRIEFRHFPLTTHPHAFQAALAAVCAAQQGKFWEMHDSLFADPAHLNVEDLKTRAVSLKLNSDQFAACTNSKTTSSIVRKDMDEGRKRLVTGTPASFINDRLLPGARSYEVVSDIIQQELRAMQR